MKKPVYRLTAATLGIQMRDGKACSVSVPAGAFLEYAVSEDSGMVRCLWDGKDVQLFALDFKERAVRVGT